MWLIQKTISDTHNRLFSQSGLKGNRDNLLMCQWSSSNIVVFIIKSPHLGYSVDNR